MISLEPKVTEVFTVGREKAGRETFKASASELLQIFPLLREFVVQIVQPTGKLTAETTSLLRLCDVVDSFLVAKQVGHIPWKPSRGCTMPGVTLNQDFRRMRFFHQATRSLKTPSDQVAHLGCGQRLDLRRKSSATRSLSRSRSPSDSVA